jgi:hypothetical protein
MLVPERGRSRAGGACGVLRARERFSPSAGGVVGVVGSIERGGCCGDGGEARVWLCANEKRARLN